MRAVFRALTTRKLQLLPENNQEQVKRYVEDYVQDVLDVVRPYPPKPADSKYERTGRLYDSWYIARSTTANGYSVRLLNDAAEDWRSQRSYAKYVQGDMQTYSHAATGWKKLRNYTDPPRYRAGLSNLYRQFRIG